MAVSHRENTVDFFDLCKYIIIKYPELYYLIHSGVEENSTYI